MSADSLRAQYSTWLLGASSAGSLVPCTDNRILDLVRQRILEEPELHSLLQNDAFPLISCGLQDGADLLLALQHLASAFQTLEQAALHLYCTPWRREFHTIKTYSGYYVHTLEAALPPDAIVRALRRLNYEPEEDGTSLKIHVLPPPQTLATAALGFLAAQMECHILSDLVSCSGSHLVCAADLIQERRSWRGEDVCMERLQQLVLDTRTVPSAAGAYNGDAFYQPQFCDYCHEPFDQHVNGSCLMVTDHGEDERCRTQVPHVDFTMHDCVFVDHSLEHCCAVCSMFHSSSCAMMKACRDKRHRVSQMTASEKVQAVMEEQRRQYQLHRCLQPGQLPHYRCTYCRQLHYIKCKEVEQCRSHGHSASMIMLEKDQRLWLQRSSMDLTLLCKS